jgi:hypothetical protein
LPFSAPKRWLLSTPLQHRRPVVSRAGMFSDVGRASCACWALCLPCAPWSNCVVGITESGLCSWKFSAVSESSTICSPLPAAETPEPAPAPTVVPTAAPFAPRKSPPKITPAQPAAANSERLPKRAWERYNRLQTGRRVNTPTANRTHCSLMP